MFKLIMILLFAFAEWLPAWLSVIYLEECRLPIAIQTSDLRVMKSLLSKQYQYRMIKMWARLKSETIILENSINGDAP